MNRNKLKETVLGGLIRNNPTFVLVLGTCPTIAMTTTLAQAFAMGLATTFVLIFSNIFVSLLRNVIPDKVRIPCYIVIISTFVIIVQMVMRRFLPDRASPPATRRCTARSTASRWASASRAPSA